MARILQQWEYLILGVGLHKGEFVFTILTDNAEAVTSSGSSLVGMLSGLGKEGWELVSVEQYELVENSVLHLLKFDRVDRFMFKRVMVEKKGG